MIVPKKNAPKSSLDIFDWAYIVLAMNGPVKNAKNIGRMNWWTADAGTLALKLMDEFMMHKVRFSKLAQDGRSARRKEMHASLKSIFKRRGKCSI